MAENKGKPSGQIAANKKDVGRDGDLTEKSPVAGAKQKTKKNPTLSAHAGGNSGKEKS
jgi:hypothetical protein